MLFSSLLNVCQESSEKTYSTPVFLMTSQRWAIFQKECHEFEPAVDFGGLTVDILIVETMGH